MEYEIKCECGSKLKEFIHKARGESEKVMVCTSCGNVYKLVDGKLLSFWGGCKI